jgi:hypothetical protein
MHAMFGEEEEADDGQKPDQHRDPARAKPTSVF